MKFFRKIRQKLVAKNKLRNYLLYAVGEIILVVIGILIALAINNGQENKILEKKEQTYLKGLQGEFEISKQKLVKLIEINRRNYIGAKQILEFTTNLEVAPSEEQFSNLLYQSFSFDIAFNPNNSLLNEMINSGSLKDITNPDLRIYLTNWISTLDDIAGQEQDLANEREKVLDMFRRDENSIRTVFEYANAKQQVSFPKSDNTISNLNLLHSVSFENNMFMFYLTSYSTEESHYNPLMQNLNSILKLLEAEIKE
tara:strand:+ start:216 stop:980 length:765 start_codon:yes stop_codon:yes gene_type:complete